MSGIPSFYSEFREQHPELARAYEALGEAARGAGPLSPREVELVKLALAAGARLEGGVHSHARRALEAGVTADELRQVPLLAITTLGFPGAMAIRALVEDVLRDPPRRG